jgi:hypothetical protein
VAAGAGANRSAARPARTATQSMVYETLNPPAGYSYTRPLSFQTIYR